jgi:hypothetical protein
VIAIPSRYDSIRTPLAAALGGASRVGSISQIEPDKPGVDVTTKFLVRDERNERVVVLLRSPPVTPGLVARGMERARQAKQALGPDLGRVILEPLIEGEIDGLTFAILPYCTPFSSSPWIWRWQKLRLRPALLRWLRKVASATAVVPADGKIEDGFAVSLERLAEIAAVGDPVRAAATRARERLARRHFSPKLVLMHGDLWKDNILIDHRGTTSRLHALDRFVVIDWPGSTLAGYPIYDLICLSNSIGLVGRRLREELDIHARILGCEPADVRTYLLAALGHTGMNLEHFPVERFAGLADACFERLVTAGG